MLNRLKIHQKISFTFILIALIGAWLWLNTHTPSPADALKRPPDATIEQLLATTDVRQGLLASLNDNDELERWQSRLLDAAEQVGYTESQLTFLEGQRGIDYLQFRAKRLAFDRDMQMALLAGQAFEPIAAMYPEAEDLFEVTQQLFEARNHAIDLATQTLIDASRDDTGSPTLSYAAANQYALTLWQQRQRSATEAKTR